MPAVRRRQETGNFLAPFHPSMIPGLALWLDASSISAKDGATVTKWTDLSGNDRDATGSGVLRKSSGAPPTGRPAVELVGQAFLGHGPGLLPASTTFVVWAPIGSGDAARSGVFCTGPTVSGDNDYGQGIEYGVGTDGESVSSLVTLMDGGAGSPDRGLAVNIPYGTYLATSSVRSAAGITTRLNGDLLGGANSGALNIVRNTETFCIGARYFNNSVIDHTSCRVASILLYDSALSDAYRLLVEQWLRVRYGTP